MVCEWGIVLQQVRAWCSSVVMVTNEMESKCCRCSSVIVGATLVVSLVVIHCSVIIQLQTMKADVARIKQQRRRYDVDVIQASCQSQVSRPNIVKCTLLIASCHGKGAHKIIVRLNQA